MTALGPGAYDVKNKDIGTGGPKFSLGARQMAKVPKRDEYNPGPGEYDPSDLLIKIRSPDILIKGRP